VSTPATVALHAAGIPFMERSYPHDPAVTDFGREAADALGVEPASPSSTHRSWSESFP
jgi:Cys-tRNA(Pro)/Cys-tRNA(Cys) deacylase